MIRLLLVLLVGLATLLVQTSSVRAGEGVYAGAVKLTDSALSIPVSAVSDDAACPVTENQVSCPDWDWDLDDSHPALVFREVLETWRNPDCQRLAACSTLSRPVPVWRPPAA